MFEIRSAKNKDYESIRDFYYSLTDEMKDSKYKPGWEKDVYPTQEFLIQSIENNELFVGELNGQIVSCMVINHQGNEGYKKIHWSMNVNDSLVYVIHALGVHPFYSGCGYAKQMVQFAIKEAEENHIKTIRLDVLSGNLPAEKVYCQFGFQYLDTIQMYYEDTGWTDFKMYEYIV